MKKVTKRKPNKHLGQNFLIDKHIKEKILTALKIHPEDIIVEIGPGEGALTELLALKGNKIIAIEKDCSLAKNLSLKFDPSNVTVINQDILKFDFDNLPHDIKIIGNIPYNISTPLIKKILDNKTLFTKAYFTVQWEFGKRLSATINTKDYGSFSCFTQYHAHINLQFKIKNTAFWPVPKVQSCFIELSPKKNQCLTPQEETLLFKIINESFKHRRKKLINTLSLFKNKEDWTHVLKRLGINPDARAENISLENFVKLMKAVKER